MTTNILILNAYYSSERDKLSESINAISPDSNVVFVNGEETDAEILRSAEIILGWPSKEQLAKAIRLKWLHLPSAGADGYTDRAAYFNKDVLLSNSSGVFGLPIAEHVFAMILAFTRNLPLYERNKQKHLWKGSNAKKDIYGSTFGIIGLGDIGSEVARRAKAWGAKVAAVKRTPSGKPDYVDELYYGEEGIDRLIEVSDFIVLALPGTEKTSGIITKERIAGMKRTAFLVNIGRGSLIDQNALIDALRKNTIAGAGLDVTSPEPLPQDSPLWELPNVIITPHVSGRSPTNPSRAIPIFLENLKLYIEGKPLGNLVDMEEGY